MTDSSATLLRGGGRESGQGRWDEYVLDALTYREYLQLLSEGETLERTEVRLGQPLERFLRSGGYPEHLLTDDFARVRKRIRTDAIERGPAVCQRSTPPRTGSHWPLRMACNQHASCRT